MSLQNSEPSLRTRIEDFLYPEAELLDDRRFDDWLELFTDEVSYVVPVRRNVARLSTGTDWAKQPRTRTRRRLQDQCSRWSDQVCPFRFHTTMYFP